MKIATAAYWLCTCVLVASLGRDAVLAGDGTRIDAVLKEAVARGDVPGVVAMAANSQGVIYQGAFGKRNVGQDEDMTVDTVFRIASMTKAVTSVAAMQLVEEGVLTLDTAIADHLPPLADLQVLVAVDREGK
jgi:CubicO group peptidase (beta-lactamase class C family)